jgi:hypothetical protein
MKIKQLILCLLVAGLGWGWCGNAQATIVTLQFQGKIERSTLGDPAFAVGTSYTGVFTYDSSARDESPTDPSYGEYSGLDFSLSFSTGATATSMGKINILVVNGLVDWCSFAGSDFAVTGSSLQLSSASLTFMNFSSSDFVDDSLPGSFHIADFNIRTFMLSCETSGTYAKGTINDIDFQDSPLPASLVLFGTALGGWLAVETLRRSKRFF